VLPAVAGHGWGMLLGTGAATWSPLAAQVAAFIRAHGAPTPRTIRFRASDGARLEGNYLPGPRPGAPAVLLVHQYRGGPDQWDPLIPVLHAAGYATLAYASRSAAELDERVLTKDVAGAVAALRKRREVDGRRIAVVGASIGASSAAYLSFSPVGRSLRAVVGLSPAEFYDDPPRGRRPHDVLLIADDRERSAAEFIADGSPGIRVRTSPVSGHGVALLPNPKVRAWVLGWLADRLGR
jgi:hypothetical protein